MPKQILSRSPASVLRSLLEKYDLNPTKLAAALKVNQSAIRQVTIGKAKISVSVASRLAKFFGTTPEYWLDLQIKYDLLEAANDKKLSKILKGIEKAAKPRGKKADKPVRAKKAAKKPVAKTVKAAKAPSKKPAAETAAKKKGAVKETIKEAAPKPNAVVAAKPARRGRPPKAVKEVKEGNVSEPKKRGRKPKVKQAVEQPVQEKLFVPRVELIKKKEIEPPSPPALEPAPAVSLPESTGE
jgi:addiction module HigA family antidote